MTDVTGVPVDVLRTLFHSDQGGHEQVVICQDRASGLKAVIALHSTALGPALGGTRFYPYARSSSSDLIRSGSPMITALPPPWSRPAMAFL